MSIAREMDAALIALALTTERARTRPGCEDLVAQLTAAIEHFEDLRLAVLALEELATRPRVVNLAPGDVVVDLGRVRAARQAQVRP